jgi:hypothetical protein
VNKRTGDSPHGITHIVAFHYKPTVTQEQRGDVLTRFLALRHECRREGKSYIDSLVGGDCSESLEGLTAGFEHAFVVSFNNRDDFEYYLGPPFASTFDPAHDDFKKFAIPLLSGDESGKTNGAIVFDFTTPS